MTSIIKVNEIQDGGGNTILSSDGSGTVTQTRTGITEADMWKLTADLTLTGNTTTDITSNLERISITGFSKIGTGMSESSGVFTFPRTGIYQITANGTIFGGLDITFVRLEIYTTTDNSTYVLTSAHTSHTHNGSYINNHNETFFDVTDTSQCKVKFKVRHQNSGSMSGTSDDHWFSSFKFIRLGDT